MVSFFVALAYVEAGESGAFLPKTNNSIKSTVVQGSGISIASERRTQSESVEKLPDVIFIGDFLDMAGKEIAKQIAYIPARKYLDAVTGSSAFSVQMAGLASWCYDLDYFKSTWPNGWAGGWELVAEYVNDTESLVVPGHDVVALFAKDNKCAISFSGTHGLADWSTNFNAKTKVSLPECGLFHAHEGFFEVFLQFLLNEAWTDEFEPYLENNCSGGIYTVGHSQGAAVAEIFAACINAAGETLTLPDLVRWGKLVHAGGVRNTNVEVSGIYTLAGPAPAWTVLTNKLDPNGIFQGVRYFNQDAWSFDPVPWMTYPMGMKHAKYAVVKLNDHPEEYAAHTDDAVNVPRFPSFVPEIFQHLPPSYMQRLMKGTRKATLKIQRAWALPDRTNAPFNNPKPDPYVVVDAKNRIWGEVYRTETKKAATDPTWDESFVLEKYEPGDEVQVTVFDEQHPWGQDQKLGSVILKKFEPQGFEGWRPLYHGAWLKVAIFMSPVDF